MPSSFDSFINKEQEVQVVTIIDHRLVYYYNTTGFDNLKIFLSLLPTLMTKKRKLVLTSSALNHVSIEQASNDHSSNQEYPYRNLTSLHTSTKTFQCAIGKTSSKPCIPCAYKIASFDIALDTSFSRVVYNCRPEVCPRSKEKVGLEGTFGYQKEMNILTIGDGDFTFSLALARMLCDESTSHNGKAWKIVATSYESKSTLQTVYPDINKTIAELEAFRDQVKIEYEVDATRLSETLSSDISKIKFHRIVWNFPCSAETNGQDGQNNAMERNKNLIKNFVRNSFEFLKSTTSEIQMIHKTKPPYDQWNIDTVALEGWSSNHEECPLEFKGRLVFDKCLLPPYTPRKALDRKSFSCHDACIYIFGYKINDNLGSEDGNVQPTIKCNESGYTELDEDDDTKSQTIIPVSKDMIDRIRKTHLLHSRIGDRKREKKNKRRNMRSK